MSFRSASDKRIVVLFREGMRRLYINSESVQVNRLAYGVRQAYSRNIFIPTLLMDNLSFQASLTVYDAKILILKNRLGEVDKLLQELGSDVLRDLERASNDQTF